MLSKLIKTIAATSLFAPIAHADESALTETLHQKGDLAFDATVGFATGYGIIGATILYALSNQLDIGVSAGVDLYNTHLGLRGVYYFKSTACTPIAYAAISRASVEKHRLHGHRDFAAAGGGFEWRIRNGFYFQGSGGLAFYTHGFDGIELRPIAFGFRF